MNFDETLGYAALAIGVMDLLFYIAHFTGIELPISFWKLKPMQERWGKTAGTLAHFVAYVVAPIVFGLMLLSGGRTA